MGRQGKKKGEGAAAPATRVKACPSFFRFFSATIKSKRMDPSAIPDDSDVSPQLST